MGVDTVSLSTQKNMYTVYRDWRYSDSKLNFKAYLLEKDERIEAFANSFKQYNRGDMFTRETVVELEDGRLLCFDPDEFSKAYLIDLSNVTKDDINFDRETDFKMIKADKSKAGYETRNDAILSYLGSDIKLKDGQTLDSYLSQIEASDDSTQAVSDTTTNLFYYKNISQMSSDDEEQEYYQYIIESLGGSVDNDGKITIEKNSALSNLNSKIKLFEKYMSKSDNQSKLNTLVLLQQLGLSELELIEKLTPGFLEQVKSFIGEYEGISYTDDNGFKSSISQVINFEKIMTYKYNKSDQYWMYLSLEDRKGVYDHTTQTFSENGGDKADFAQVKAARTLTNLSSTTSASLESTMEANLEQRVSSSTISDYVKEFNDIFNTSQDGLKEDHTYDEALEYLAMLCTDNVSGEILYEFLQDSDVQKCLITLGIQKGTLPTGKTADKSEEEQLTVQAVYRVMAEKINSYVEETYTIMGDEERIAATKVSNATISFLDMAAGGINVKYNEGQSCFFAYGLGAEAVVQAGLAVWANREANAIVEKSTKKALKNAAENALDEATKAVNDATKAATEAAAKKAATEADEVVIKALNKAAVKRMREDVLRVPNRKKLIEALSDEEIKRFATSRHKISSSSDIAKYRQRLTNHKKSFEHFLKNMDDEYLIKLLLDENDKPTIFINYRQEYLNDEEFIEEIKKSDDYIKKYNEAYKNTYNEVYNDKFNNKINEAAEKASKSFNAAAELDKAQEAADNAAKKYKQAQKNLEGKLDDIIRKKGKYAVKDKELLEKLKKLNKGKTVNLDVRDFAKIKELKGNNLGGLQALEGLHKKVKETNSALEAAKELRGTTKSSMVNTLNDEMKIKRYKDAKWYKLGKDRGAQDVADAIGNSVDLVDNTGTVKLNSKNIDGITKIDTPSSSTTSAKKLGKGIFKKSGSSNATTATKALRLGGVFSKLFMGVDCVSAAIDGGMMGYGIASWAVENNANNFINEDGSYDTTRANVARGFGAAAGACFGLAVGMWTSGVGAAINAATGGIAGTVVGVVAGAAGAVCTAISAISCFTKWFK